MPELRDDHVVCTEYACVYQNIEFQSVWHSGKTGICSLSFFQSS